MKARKLLYKGKRLTIPEWSKEIGLNQYTLYRRLYQGWSIGEALSIPRLSPKQSRARGLAFKNHGFRMHGWCLWCGAANDDMDFCDAQCMTLYWRDVKESMPHEMPERSITPK